MSMSKCPAQESKPLCRLFCSHQFTQEASRCHASWLSNPVENVKASTPPFNTRLGVELPPSCVELNIATFGVRLPVLIMKLFESDDMRQLSKDLSIPIPAYAMDTFVQKKMAKVLDLVAEARKPEQGLEDQDLEAIARLERFCKAFSALDGKQMTGPGDFQAFVEEHVEQGWEEHLHFDSILIKVFGMSQKASEQLRATKIKVMEKDKEEEVSLEHHAVRWLAKAFKGYGPVGCLTDVVNLAFAMLGLPQPAEASEEVAMSAISQLQEALNRGEFNNLWIPTHFAHDAESDDSLAWLLLEYIHRSSKTSLEVLIQLPTDPKFDDVEAFLTSKHSNLKVFRDKESENGKAVGNVWLPVVALEKAATEKEATEKAAAEKEAEKVAAEKAAEKEAAEKAATEEAAAGKEAAEKAAAETAAGDKASADKATKAAVAEASEKTLRQEAKGVYHIGDQVQMRDAGKVWRDGYVTSFDVAYKVDGPNGKGYAFDEVSKIASDGKEAFSIGEHVCMRDSGKKWRQGYITSVKVAYKSDGKGGQGYYFDQVQKMSDMQEGPASPKIRTKTQLRKKSDRIPSPAKAGYAYVSFLGQDFESRQDSKSHTMSLK